MTNSTPNDNPLIIGWIGNSQNLYYFDQIDLDIKEILNQNGIEFHIMTDNIQDVSRFDSVGSFRAEEWSMESEIDFLKKIDVGIRPLICDQWTIGKGGFTSIVQMMLSSIPVVASPVGMVPNIIKNRRNGFLATDEETWHEYIHKLLNKPAMRRKFGENARSSVIDDGFTTRDYSQKLFNILSQNL
ncbi:glycosyltransferase [Halorubrum ezzemoulense]|uniref:glycosyltransferase n=1 Tax=Halorubrum ezzemoulense TaxID=337243 RepID=UPI00232DAE9C|nr:glycosyltransferase [Halorubrum ezzemoulense]MDB9235523.1 glycosyltransferase [Halorubrum ezzemoulense]